MEINENFIIEVLKFICEKLNDHKINYFIAGALAAYIDAGLPIQRIHDDIDIVIEEKYIDDLKKIFDGTDFEFHDNRLSSNKVLNKHGFTEGDHEVYAQYKYGNFYIGFFLIRYDDTSYTFIDYFDDNGIIKKLERTLPISFFNAQYNDISIDYFDISLKTTRKETIYKNKFVMNREKDLFDIEKLKPTIEADKLDRLKNLSKHRKTAIVDL